MLGYTGETPTPEEFCRIPEIINKENARVVLANDAFRELRHELEVEAGSMFSLEGYVVSYAKLLGIDINELFEIERGSEYLIDPDNLTLDLRLVDYDGLANYIGFNALDRMVGLIKPHFAVTEDEQWMDHVASRFGDVVDELEDGDLDWGVYQTAWEAMEYTTNTEGISDEDLRARLLGLREDLEFNLFDLYTSLVVLHDRPDAPVEE